RRRWLQPRRARRVRRAAPRQGRRHPRRTHGARRLGAAHRCRCSARSDGGRTRLRKGSTAVTTADDTYRSVMMTEPPAGQTPLEVMEREQLFGGLWARPGLSVRDRRFVTIACASAAVDATSMDEHVYAALASGDLTVEQLNELTLHFAVYCGWPRASQLEMTVRGQWQRLHEERGEPVPAFPMRGLDELDPADPAERLAAGVQS